MEEAGSPRTDRTPVPSNPKMLGRDYTTSPPRLPRQGSHRTLRHKNQLDMGACCDKLHSLGRGGGLDSSRGRKCRNVERYACWCSTGRWIMAPVLILLAVAGVVAILQ